jgi:hypothetical protein
MYLNEHKRISGLNHVKMVVFQCLQVAWQSQAPIRFLELKHGLILG